MDYCIQVLQREHKATVEQLNRIVTNQLCYPTRKRQLENRLKLIKIGITKLKE